MISSRGKAPLRMTLAASDEILTLSGRRHRTPQNDKVDGRDCHVTTFLAMTEQLTPFSKEGDQYLSIYFLPQLLPRKWNESLSFFRFQFTYKKLKLRLL
jgi:hypothetical protein